MSTPVGFGNIPAELRTLKQWVNWKIEQSDGRETKVPYQPSGVKASTTDPRTWSTFERVCKSNGDLAGNIGFVFTKENGYVGIDFDKCRNKETGETEKRANEAIRELNSYTEVSQSFTGWHVMVKGALPAGGNRRGRIEMYETGRFFCMTGRILPGCGAINRRDLSVLHKRMLAGEFDDGDSAKRKSARDDESREDWRLIGEVYKECRATDADALEDAFRKAHPERYEERNATKKRRGSLTYFRYTIENFIKGKAKQGAALADGGKITDAGNATLLVAAHRDDLLYCFEMRKWLFWDGKRWQKDDKQRARVLMEETMRERVTSLVRPGATPKEIAEACACLNTYRLTNGLHEAEKKLGIGAAELDKHKFLLTFENGTLDLETMRPREHKRTDFITKMVHCNYNPQAARPEKFLALLKHALREDSLPYLQKLLGYSLTADTSEKIFMIVQGEGDTGKTTFLEIIRSALKDYAVLLQVDSLMEKRGGGDSSVQEDLVSLRGARLATTSEIDRYSKLSVKTVKRIVQGNGMITASAKYEKKITFAETHKLWLDSNFLPAIPANDGAIWNRLCIIVFENPVPKDQQDRQLCESILRDEMEGVLAWMVEGERLRQSEGLGDVPKHFNEKKEKHHKSMDTMQQFLQECCESGLRGEKDALYNAYVAWAGPRHALSPRLFTTEMGNKGYAHDAGRRHYKGIALLQKLEAGEDK